MTIGLGGFEKLFEATEADDMVGPDGSPLGPCMLGHATGKSVKCIGQLHKTL